MNTATNNDVGTTELHRAADAGDEGRVLSLLKSGAHAGTPNDENQLPLYSALNLDEMHENEEDTKDEKMRRERIFRELWKANPETVLHVDEDGNTVLHRMAFHGFDVLAREVLEKHPELAGECNHQGHYPIHTAVLNSQARVAEVLFKVEGVSGQRNYKKASALHLAAGGGTLDMVRLCCEQSPEMLNEKDRFLNTPFALATHFNTPEVQGYIQSQPGIDTVIDTGAITKVG